MANRKWDEEDWDTLIYTINEGNCILMLGPDCATEEIDGTFKPLSEILANQLAESAKPYSEVPGIDCSNLSQAAQCYFLKAKRNSLERKVKSFFREKLNLTNELHTDLAELPFYLTVSTSPDNMFYNALKKKKAPRVQGYNFRGDKQDSIEMGTVEEPLIYYLYGIINEPKSLVLTEDDILDFLVNIISKNPELPVNLHSELLNKDKGFLFLGFGFKHWYLRILLRILQGNEKENLSFAFEQHPQEEIEFQRSILFFKEINSKSEIRIYDGELQSFVKKLKEEYKKSKEENSEEADLQVTPILPKQHAPKEEATIVFICHANKDKDFAKKLYDKLKKEGFDPWLDVKDLEVGDQWDYEIEKAIAKKISYFIVIQSVELAKRNDGYVNKEINLALERQRRVRRGYKFILPVKIGEAKLLEELEHLQTLDLSNEENFENLVNSIKRDQIKKAGES